MKGDLGMSAMGIICSPGRTHMMGPSSLSVGLCSRRLEKVPHGRVLYSSTKPDVTSWLRHWEAVHTVMQFRCTQARRHESHWPLGRGSPPTCWWTRGSNLPLLRPQRRPGWPAAWPRRGTFPGSTSVSPAGGGKTTGDVTYRRSCSLRSAARCCIWQGVEEGPEY